MTIVFETQEDFEKAVMSVIENKLRLNVYVSGNEFVKGVEAYLINKFDDHNYFCETSDSV